MPVTQAQKAHADTLTDEDLVELARARDEAAVREMARIIRPGGTSGHPPAAAMAW